MRRRAVRCPSCRDRSVTAGEQVCQSFSDGHAHAVALTCERCGWRGADLQPASCADPAGEVAPALGKTA